MEEKIEYPFDQKDVGNWVEGLEALCLALPTLPAGEVLAMWKDTQSKPIKQGLWKITDISNAIEVPNGGDMLDPIPDNYYESDDNGGSL